ncbi:MAG TPA: hypothetical protein VHW01_15315 [Polyangiaceae bacterium]|nr:hypothetical protein [Polyangiaceae bacterium]
MLNEKLGKALLAMLAAFTIAGCGKEVGRVPFSAEGSKTSVAQLAAGDVAFWTDLDIKYDGDAALEYRVDLLQDGSSVASAVCDPLGPLSIKELWSESRSGASRSESGMGKMACSAHLAKGGVTAVQTSLAFGIRPVALALAKADLVLKQ